LPGVPDVAVGAEVVDAAGGGLAEGFGGVTMPRGANARPVEAAHRKTAATSTARTARLRLVLLKLFLPELPGPRKSRAD
jgi:hypothetical protein